MVITGYLHIWHLKLCFFWKDASKNLFQGNTFYLEQSILTSIKTQALRTISWCTCCRCVSWCHWLLCTGQVSKIDTNKALWRGPPPLVPPFFLPSTSPTYFGLLESQTNMRSSTSCCFIEMSSDGGKRGDTLCLVMLWLKTNILNRVSLHILLAYFQYELWAGKLNFKIFGSYLCTHTTWLYSDNCSYVTLLSGRLELSMSSSPFTSTTVILQDSFVMGKKLAQGGFGTVYRGQLREEDGSLTEVVIKRVNSPLDCHYTYENNLEAGRNWLGIAFGS